MTGRADVQGKDGRQTCQLEITTAKKNARKHIASISYSHYSRDKIARTRSMRDRQFRFYINIYSNCFSSSGEYKKTNKQQQHNNCWNMNLKRKTEHLLCCACTAFSQSHFKPKLTFQWTWGPPPLPVRSKRSLLNVERSRSDFQIYATSKPLCSAHDPFMYSASKHKQWQHADMKFPFPCLLFDMMKFTHSVRLTHRKCLAERAGHVLPYKLCYQPSLLWEVDLWLLVCNER